MRKMHMRPLAFAFSMIVFACLLVAGGDRLIGHELSCEPASQESFSLMDGALCAAPVLSGEISFAAHQERAPGGAAYAAAAGREEPCASVCSDANGNVLGGQSYLHAVYQAFSLGDGFV